MTTLRRRVLRSEQSIPAEDPRRQRQAERRRQQLAAKRRLLRRWLTRLFRASHAVERLQASIHRAERKLGDARVTA